MKEKESLQEVSPPGWKGTVKAMKKHKEIDNPWALAWHMKNKGNKPHYKDQEGKPEKKAKYKNEQTKGGYMTFDQFLMEKTGCTCCCEPCKDGDCSGCTCEDCHCDGCTCDNCTC